MDVRKPDECIFIYRIKQELIALFSCFFVLLPLFPPRLWVLMIESNCTLVSQVANSKCGETEDCIGRLVFLSSSFIEPFLINNQQFLVFAIDKPD